MFLGRSPWWGAASSVRERSPLTWLTDFVGWLPIPHRRTWRSSMAVVTGPQNRPPVSATGWWKSMEPPGPLTCSDYIADQLQRPRNGFLKAAGIPITGSGHAAPEGNRWPLTRNQLIISFDCLHDMGDPVGAARHIRDARLRRHLAHRRT